MMKVRIRAEAYARSWTAGKGVLSWKKTARGREDGVLGN
jgi:hypothetical protein